MSKANSNQRLAARFAAKEAGMKALGTGLSHGIQWKNFEVVNDLSGRPALRLSGVAKQLAGQLGVQKTSLSLTHTATTAFAVVIFESGG